MAANPIFMTITQASLDGSGNAPIFSYDYRDTPFNVTVAVTLVGATTVTGYTLQGTLQDLNAVPPLPQYTKATATWLAETGMTSSTSSGQVALTSPRLFGRLNVNTLSAGGSLLLVVVQGSTMPL